MERVWLQTSLWLRASKYEQKSVKIKVAGKDADTNRRTSVMLETVYESATIGGYFRQKLPSINKLSVQGGARSQTPSPQPTRCAINNKCCPHFALKVILFILRNSGAEKRLFYATLATIHTAAFAQKALRSAPHTVFMCFVFISEQTAIISLYSIN
jgi:hypothetical protein